MEAKKIKLTLLLMLVLYSAIAQEISRKAQREKNKIEKQNQVELLINSKEFVFVADRLLPQGGKSVDLTTNTNSVTFRPDKIESYLPFYGRAYSIDYGGDGGIKFEGKPQEYTIVNRPDGKGYDVSATIPVPRDNYKLSLYVTPEGSATLTVISNQRSNISYYGAISKVKSSE